MYNKAQAELTDSINQANSLHQQKLEERLLSDDALKKKLQSSSSLVTDDAAPAGQGADKADGDAADCTVASVADSAAKEPVQLQKKYELRSHMDMIRDIQFVPSVEAMATISEDCMVKLWSLAEIERKMSEQNDSSAIEPYFTLRGHTGPLLSIAGVNDVQRSSENKNLIFTAGIEGNIRVWNVP